MLVCAAYLPGLRLSTVQDCASTLRLSLLFLFLVRLLVCLSVCLFLFVNTYCLSALACRTGDIFCLFCFSDESDVGDHEAQDARRKGGEKSIITLIFRIYLFLLWLYFSPPFPSAAHVWRSPPPHHAHLSLTLRPVNP